MAILKRHMCSLKSHLTTVYGMITKQDQTSVSLKGRFRAGSRNERKLHELTSELGVVQWQLFELVKELIEAHQVEATGK